ncbi:MAG: hypothetical protein RLZZ163_198 [Actinomycetota bacterium]|jgi:hypothetical protein
MTVVVDVRSESGRDHAAHARGVLFLHSCPSAVAPHLEWALARVFGASVDVDWAPQPVLPGQVRAEVIWHGPRGSASKVASALVAFSTVRFEVTEDPTAGTEGERYAATPNLGLFRATIGVHGDVLVHEDRLRSLLAGARIAGSAADASAITEEIDRLIGTPWDHELEPFRIAHEDSTVRVLHEVV